MRDHRQFGVPIIVPKCSETATAARLEKIPYDRDEGEDEKWLQQIIHRHPEILPIEELEPAYQPVVPACMEMRTPQGFIDNVYVTPQGNLIFAECKLWRNPAARREVVAQVLDYIAGMSRWTCEDLEDAVMKARSTSEPGTTRKLHDLIKGQPESLDELRFNDAVSRNLRLGRGLFLIVGDGIREGAKTLVDHVSTYPGLHFSLALVEIVKYRLPDGGGYLLQPRTVARTVNVERAIVRIENGTTGPSASIKSPVLAAGNKSQNLTEEEFFEKFREGRGGDWESRIRSLLKDLEDLDVTSEFKTASLILRYPIPNTDIQITLVEIHHSGTFWTDKVHTKDVHDHGLDKIARQYREDMASIIGGTVDHSKPTVTLKRNGKTPTIDVILHHKDEWLSCVQKLQDSLREETRNAS